MSIPGYEILGVLGRGGMGVVYKARHLRLKRVVALKMILAGSHAGPEELARFRIEAEAVARLQHPHIVQIYEVGEHNGLPFFSLEFCEGGSLERKIASKPQPAREAAALMMVLARAMHHAHQRGVIHRDLKPANVLLSRTEPGDAGRSEAPEQASHGLGAFEPKITDFGLAKQLDEARGQTFSGAVMGTPSYMAPEQAQGQIKDIGPRTDVYALGAMLYELLTGGPPFKGATVMEVLGLVTTEEPVPPRRLQPRISHDLETICLKCLRKQPDKRYASAEALARDLGRFLEGQPILARPVPAWERVIKWTRRRPAQALLVATIALAFLGVVFGALFYQNQQAATLRQLLERRQRVDQLWAQGETAETAGKDAEAEKSWDQALAILDAEPDTAPEETRRRIQDGLERVRSRLEKQAARQDLLANQQEFQSRVQRFGPHRDRVLWHAVNFRPKEAAADSIRVREEAPAALAQLGLAVGEKPEEFGTRLASHQRLEASPGQLDQLAADCYQVLLAWAEAEAAVPPGRDADGREVGPQQALRILDAAAALGKTHRLSTPQVFHEQKAHCLELLGDKVRAREERAHIAGASQSALDYFLAASASYRQGQVEEAAASCEEALRQESGHYWAQYLKALCCMRAKRWGEAKVGFTACLARRREFRWPLQLRGLAHVQLKEFPAAERDFDQALVGADEKDFRAAVLSSRSVLRIGQGRLDDAERDLQEAIELQPDAYQGYVTLATAYEGRKDFSAAVKVMDQVLAKRPNDADLYYARGRLHVERGDAKAARRDFQETIDRQPRGSKSDRLVRARVELAHLRLLAGEYEAALADCDAALAVRPDYADAHRQRYQTLVKLKKYAEAGQALDRYLARGSRRPLDYRARGLIHLQLHEYSGAVEAFTQALLLKPDAETLTDRGWAYLALEAARPALADFEESLRRESANTAALCGRAMAQVMLGQVTKADKDAREALEKGPQTQELLLNGARIYARAMALAEVTRDQTVRQKAANYQTRALELLWAALKKVPEHERAAFCRDTVLRDPALLLLRRTSGMQQLARSYGR